MTDCIILIDGAYLSLVSKFLGNGEYLKFDIKEFSENLARAQGFDSKEIYYYICPPFQSEPPTEEQTKRKAGYDKFISKMKKIGVNVREGRCQMIEGKYNQKGVDVLLSIDFIRQANQGIKNFILVACDTDFVPAIIDIQKKDNANVILYYLKDKDSRFSMSDHILDICNKKVEIKLQDFEDARCQ